MSSLVESFDYTVLWSREGNDEWYGEEDCEYDSGDAKCSLLRAHGDPIVLVNAPLVQARITIPWNKRARSLWRWIDFLYPLTGQLNSLLPLTNSYSAIVSKSRSRLLIIIFITENQYSYSHTTKSLGDPYEIFDVATWRVSRFLSTGNAHLAIFIPLVHQEFIDAGKPYSHVVLENLKAASFIVIFYRVICFYLRFISTFVFIINHNGMNNFRNQQINL